MSNNSNFQDDEVDLGELVAALWAHKILIVLVTSLSVFIAGYQTLKTEKKYTASAVFQIDKNNNSGLNIPGELGALASLAGFSGAGGATDTDILLERLTGREFILDVSSKNSLEQDLFFNTFNPDLKDPTWKRTLKKIVGWKEPEAKPSALIEKNILTNFKKNVTFQETKGGAIKVSVTHVDPKKASDYANNFMEEIRLFVKNEITTQQDLRLSYLSETLADALQEVEQAQEKLKIYALENSALAQENFISGSLKLDEIRMEKRKVEEISSLLFVLRSLAKSGNLDSASYENLRLNHPLVDDVDFRRILGMSETISAWTWPNIETIEAVITTLKDRIKRLDVDIQNIEENAKIYASSAEKLAKFTRDAKIAEATYTVLIEQVKSQTLAAGFKPETFKVFEYATTPLIASSPNRNLNLAIGMILGIAFGGFLALLNFNRRGVCYTSTALISTVEAKLVLKSKPIKRLSRKSFSDISSFISNRGLVVLDEAGLKVANKKVIYVISYGGQPTASGVARLLAAQSAKSGKSVVLCDTTSLSDKETEDKSKVEETGLPIVRMGENINLMAGVYEATFFTSTTFNSTIKDLTDRFDQVILCSSTRYAHLGLMALLEFLPGLVMVASLRKTRKSDIRNTKVRQSIDLLLYD